ncbi:hypothetical protein Peur_009577 [Populus x canadensis]
MNPSNFKQSGHNLSNQAAKALMQIANSVLQSGPQLFFLNLFSERLPFHGDRSRKAGFFHHPRSSMSSDLWHVRTKHHISGVLMIISPFSSKWLFPLQTELYAKTSTELSPRHDSTP